MIADDSTNWRREQKDDKVDNNREKRGIRTRERKKHSRVVGTCHHYTL